MEHSFRRPGPGILGIVAMGVVLVIMGVPFLGMAVITAMLLSPEKRLGLTLAAITVFCVYLLSDFSGALIAAAGAGVMSVALKTGRNLSVSISLACGAASMASIFGTLIATQQSMLSAESMETLLSLYQSAGLSSTEIDLIMGILFYLLPSLLALWASAGTIAAGAAVQVLSRRRRDLPTYASGTEEIKLGLEAAWILIAALAVNLSGTSLPAFVRQASVNISIFMVLPYSVVGFAVFRAALRKYPSMILITPVAILLPPFGIGLLMLTGILDTWFDFRSRLKKTIERTDE